MGNALPQRLRLPVFQASHRGGHGTAEDVVGGLQNLPAGAEILRQEDLPSLTWICLPCRDKFPVFFQENAGVRQTEAINGLFHVAHQEAIAPLPGQSFKNPVLDLIGVLVFIHHHLPEPFPNLPGGPGGP